MVLDNSREIIALISIVGIIATLVYVAVSDFTGNDDYEVVNSGLMSHRYAFEHKYFKLLLFDDPYNLFQRFMDYGEGAVIGAWNNIGVNVPNELARVDALYSDELATFIHKQNETFYITIKMPKPKKATECYYIGLIFPDKNIIENVRYIMLIKEVNEHGEERTVLGEWTNKDKYIALSEGITPRTDVFEQVLIDLVEKRSSAQYNLYEKKV